MTEKKRITIKNDDGTFTVLEGQPEPDWPNWDEMKSSEEFTRQLADRFPPFPAPSPYDMFENMSPTAQRQLIETADRRERERYVRS